MASFTTANPDLVRVGPCVEMHLAVGAALETALQSKKLAVPNPVRLFGMVDTGASGCVVREGVPASLGLNPTGTVQINTPSTTEPVECNKYWARFILPNNVLYEGPIIEAPMKNQHINCLIGRDLLSHAVLVYIGYANQFTLSF